MGFVVHNAALLQVFTQYFRFPLATDYSTLIIIIIIRGWYNRPVLASVIVDSIPFHSKRGGGIQEILVFLLESFTFKL
jgi:hypothetical protein